MTERAALVAALRRRYPAIHVIVSPPRCSSTAFARLFWQHPEVRYYSHEPFEVTYYEGRGVEAVAAKLARPLDLLDLDGFAGERRGERLVVKEMPYQVGDRFPLLAEIATPPIVFLLRDPRLNIRSRMRKKREAGEAILFPEVETGWELLRRQVEWCREQGVPHLLVYSRDFRNRPLEVLPEVFDQLGLEFSPALIEWPECAEVELDNLGGRHSHLYQRVLESTGIVPEEVEVPTIESFPETGGWRRHVVSCLEIFSELADADERVLPDSEPGAG